MEASIELRELMPLEEEKEISLEDRVKGHVKAIRDIEKSKKGFFRGSRRKKAVREFVADNPSGADDLVDYFKLKSGYVQRPSTWGNKTRVGKAIDEYEITQTPNAFKRFLKRHPAVFPSILATQGFISLLSPSHPLMVDAYLAGRGIGIVSEMIAGPKVSDEELRGFLTTKEQALKYESDVIKDLEDLDSEKIFSIVEKDGKLEQKDVRTMNSLVVKYLPFLNAGLDNKGFDRLDDKVDLWLNDYEHVANGHYHVFGEAPSSGDLLVSKLSPGREIVVVNGFADKKVFMDGKLVSFGEGIEVSDEVEAYFVRFSLLGKVNPVHFGKSHLSNNPFDCLESYLGYLQVVHDVDVGNIEDIRLHIMRFYQDNMPLYEKIFTIHETNQIDNNLTGNYDNLASFRVFQRENFEIVRNYSSDDMKTGIIIDPNLRIGDTRKYLDEYPGGKEQFMKDLFGKNYVRPLGVESD